MTDGIDNPSSRPARLSTGFAQFAGVLCAVTGLIVLAGWAFDIEILKTLMPGFVTMKPLTAVCFLFTGLSLSMQVASARPRWTLYAELLAGLALIIGLLTAIEYFGHINFGIDDILFHQAVHDTRIPFPGRMAPVTAMLFFVTGIALLLINHQIKRTFRLAPFLGLITALTGVVALLGYMYSIQAISEFSSYQSLALHTAILFLILGLGVMLSRPTESFVAVFTTGSAGGVMARRLLPLVLTGPFVIGYLRLVGERAHLYTPGVGFAVASVVNITIYSTVVWLVARELNHADSDRQKAAERDSRLAAIVDYSEDAIIGTDLDGVITSWNRGASNVYGFTENEALGRQIADILIPKDRFEEALQLRREVVAGRAVPLFETLHMCKEGLVVQVSLTVSPVRDAGGRITGSARIARDITAQKQIEAEARAAEERLREHARILDLAQVMIRDLDNRIVLWNRGAELLFGFPPGEAIGRVSYDLLKTEFPEPLEDIDRQLRSTGVWEGELVHFKKNGDKIVVASKWVLHIANGRPARILETNSDITALKRAEDSLIQSQKMQAIGTLAGGIAHDFNNILLAILGHASFAAEDLPQDHPVQKDITAITKAGQRASSLVTQILTFSRHQETKRVVTKLGPIVDEALKLLRSTLPAMIEIDARYEPSLSDISVDGTQVHQIVMNLGTNAAHAMGEGGGLIEVRIADVAMDKQSAELHGDLPPGRYVRLSVHDSGCGMTQSTVKRIFDPFFTTKPPGKGTGLGLAVVHGIMKSHGGSITVYSELGRGTTFQLFFPVSGVASEMETPVRLEALQGKGERVLCVDDEKPIISVVSRILERLGYQVTAHTEASNALLDFSANPGEFGALVTDLALRGMSGLDLVEELRRIRPDLPVVMTSGYFNAENTERAMRLGVKELIVKPNTLGDLGNALHRAIEEKHLLGREGLLISPRTEQELH